MRQHPSTWDRVNRHRAWFKTLQCYGWPSEPSRSRWSHYVAAYHIARARFNELVTERPRDAFTLTEWCLLRQPFPHRWTRWDHVLAHMPKDHWGAILDYGCGTGEMLAWLRTRRPMYLYDGIDLDSPQRRYAEWRGFDAPRLKNRHDIVTCYETLEHLPDPVKAVEEMLAYLRPGGVLLWDFIDERGGGNVAGERARTEVLRMLNGTTGQREVYQR